MLGNILQLPLTTFWAARSVRPSPLKSPATNPFHVVAAGRPPNTDVVNAADDPRDTVHCPEAGSRAAMSARRSASKSPTVISVHTVPAAHVARISPRRRLLPSLVQRRQFPFMGLRAMMSARPSPSKSAARTPCHGVAASILPQTWVSNPVGVPRETVQAPVAGSRPATSAPPSPSKSPWTMSVQATFVAQVPATVEAANDPPVEASSRQLPVVGLRTRRSTRPSALKSPLRAESQGI